MAIPRLHSSGLAWLSELTSGSAYIGIGLVDGPIAQGLDALRHARIHSLGGASASRCSRHVGSACSHGTFMVAALVAGRDSAAPGLCPGCQVFSRPIFVDDASGDAPAATAGEVADAIVECVEAGVRIVNISASIRRCDRTEEHALSAALGFAARRGVMVVAASGNDGTTSGSVLTRNAAVIPVTACSSTGHPMNRSNYGRSIGQRGVSVPAQDVVGFGPDGNLRAASGTSVAAVLATGAIALLWSLFPGASVDQVTGAVVGVSPRRSIVPPLLNARSAVASLQGRSARAG